MKGLWPVDRGLWIRDLGADVFFFEFAEDKERQRVLSMEPWFFDKALVVLKEVGGDDVPK